MPFSSTQTTVLAVCFPTTVLLLYLLWKYRDKDETAPPVARPAVVTSRQTVIEIKVPKMAVGAVIGTSGATIKDIQDTSGCRVKFIDDDTEDDKDRTLMVRGTHESAQRAELIIRKIIAEVPPTVDDAIPVPCRAIGRIIGKGGQSIRQMMRTSRAKINVPKERGDSKNGVLMIALRGTPQAIDTAKGLIQEKVDEEDSMRAQVALGASHRTERGKSKQEYLGEPHSAYKAREEIPPGEPHMDFTHSRGIENGPGVSSMEQNEEEPSDNILTPGGDIWPNHGDFFEVFVSAVDTAGHFWVQRCSAHSAQLDRLINQMTQAYTNPEFSGDSVCLDAKPGDIIAAPFTFDDRYYRARVVNSLPDEYDVYYVDFGDNGMVPRHKAMQLRAEFQDLPHQAFECELADVEPSGESWSDEATDSFEELAFVAKWKVINCRTKDYKRTDTALIPRVELVNTHFQQDVNVAEELVRQGLAVWSSPNRNHHSAPSSGQPENQPTASQCPFGLSFNQPAANQSPFGLSSVQSTGKIKGIPG